MHLERAGFLVEAASRAFEATTPGDQSSPKNHLGRVLVVDDDDAMLRLCARVLGARGWLVTVADHGASALDKIDASNVPFDCVVSDVNMPELDGFDLTQVLRCRDDVLPVLLMTGDPSLDGAVRAIDRGAVSYLGKPFAPEALASAVARAARRHRIARTRREAASHRAGDDDLDSRFENALARSWMAFQPIVDVAKHEVFAFEALLRTEEESLRRPDLFIATAERLDRIHELGRNVRAKVAAAAADSPVDTLLFVNVHGLELMDEELYAADSPLSKLAPRIVLELTERIGIDPAVGARQVARLRKLGYRIAVDDLGAGYSALGALATLEPEIVKLDMSLIRDLDRYPAKRRVVLAIAALCRDLGSRVVAEGVETEAERVACVDAGIDLLQGYLFAKPQRGFISIVRDQLAAPTSKSSRTLRVNESDVNGF
jgi:EAL domain-containing protein (putative c-di-GMP-specific phosphodiesterase class I)